MKKIKYMLFLQIIILSVSCGSQESKNNNTLFISDVWVREVPGGSQFTAGYMKIENLTETDDRLFEVNCDFAKKTEIHKSYVDENDLAHMEKLDSIEILSNETVELSPGGYHLMFMGVDQSLNSRDKVRLELNFEKNGKKIIEAEVKGF